MKDEVRSTALIVVVALVALASCQRPVASDVVSPTVPMRQVTDDLGRTVTVPVKITRVVSTAPSITEMIFAAGADDRLVGVTTFCDYPEEAKTIAKIGDTMTPNIETILALAPDVVFVSTDSQLESFTKTLAAQGVSVYVIAPGSMMGLDRSLTDLGGLFDTSDITERLTQEMAWREDVIRTTLRTYGTPEDLKLNPNPVRVFVQISREPLFTIGSGAILNEIIGAAGGRSVTAGVPTAYPKLSKETALALRPEVIILSDSPDNQEPNDAFRNSPAVKNGRVYKVNADLLSRPGPRLVDALEQIARHLHPDKFGQTEK